VEIEQRYDNIACVPPFVNSTQCIATVNLKVPEEMKKPVFLYYKLENVYQNHRRYVKSRSDAQLAGTSNSDIKSCDPLQSSGGAKLYPCGLIANSYFRDTFNLTVGGSPVTLDERNIAWKSDKDKKFLASDVIPAGFTNIAPGRGGAGDAFQMPSIRDEHFIVWMRTAGLPTFKKLYARINRDLKKDEVVNFQIDSLWEVASFEGKKSVVLSTTNWLGGKNDFLGYAYIVVGAISLLLGLAFWVKHCISPRQMGDMHYLNWGGPVKK
jgi:hypothetical protein